jgi:SPP1 family predicted phage head-tail adaptor
VISQRSKKVTLQRRTVTRDGHGQPIETWADQGLIWISLRPLTAREIEMNAERHEQVTHEAKARAPLQIDAKDRLKYGDRIFEVASVIDRDEEGVEIVMTLVERRP